MSENEKTNVETLGHKDRQESRRTNYKKRENVKDKEDNSSNDSKDFVKRRIYMRKKVCRFCNDKRLIIDYKNIDILRRFTTEGGKIIPRRITGNCAKHQRVMAKEIKRARCIALLPYVKK